MRSHDLFGNMKDTVYLGAFATSDNSKADIVWVAPFKCEVLTVLAYPQTQVVGGTATDYFTLTAYCGTTAFGTTALTGTVAAASGSISIFSGTQDFADGDKMKLTYGTAGGTAELACPRSAIVITYRGA